MGAVSSRVRIALSSGASGLEPGREFLQDRLGVFGFWSGVLSLFFLLLRFVGEALVQPSFSVGRLVATAGFLSHATASATGLLLWALARRPRAIPAPMLRRLDAAATLTIATAFALMGATIAGTAAALVSQPQVAMLSVSSTRAHGETQRLATTAKAKARARALKRAGIDTRQGRILRCSDTMAFSRYVTSAAAVSAERFGWTWQQSAPIRSAPALARPSRSWVARSPR